MKTSQLKTSVMMCCAMLTVSPLLGQTDSRTGNQQQSQQQQQRTGANQSGAQRDSSQGNAASVRVTRASNFIGTDVTSTDNRKIGDIVDFYFNVAEVPHLEYVVIMTGGFLNIGGDTRAVPASAITMQDDSARIDISSDRYWDVPVLPENRHRFLSDNSNAQRISQMFGQGQQQGQSERNRQQQSQQQQMAQRNRQGSQNEMGRDLQLVSFNELRNSELYSSNDQRLGYLIDAWISLDRDRAPYVEISPTFEPFRTSFDRRYAIPTEKLQRKRGEFLGYSANITTEQLNQAEAVSETEGVTMLRTGEFRNAVLRVTVPRN